MACSIIRNTEGKIIKVLNPKTGKESKLFNEIAKLPHVESLERAVKIYDEILKSNPQDDLSGFVSNAIAAITNLKDKAVKNIKGWINQLTDVQKNGGIRSVKQELDWIGLEEYLNEWVAENKPKNNNIPLEVVEQYIKDNQVEIVEVSKGAVSLLTQKDIKEVRLIEGSENNYEVEYNDGFIDKIYDAKDKEEASYLSVADSNRAIESEKVDTKYSEYQLEGGENYREVLLTLPNKKSNRYQFLDKKIDELADKKKQAEVKYGENAWREKDKLIKEYRPFIDEWREFEDKAYADSKKNYQSSHWEESNILAHIRINERTLPNGERVLFIEEVQSDWAQDGKKKGFKGERKLDEIGDIVNTIDGNATVIDIFDNGSLYVEYEDGKQKKLGHFDYDKKIDNGLSNMPYKKTDQWVGMVMRRVMQMATQEGFDRIAWVTGEQSADRYDLSKQIQTVRLVDIKAKYPGQNLSKQYALYAYGKDGNIVMDKMVEENEIEDNVGKEVAKKLLSKETKKDEFENSLKGQDLKVGGEGMKTFYNSILPKVAKKEAQRLDKQSKIEVVDFNDSDNKSYFETVKIEGENFYKLMVDGQFVEGVEDSTLRQNNLSENEEGARKYLDEYIPQYTNTQGAGQQLSIPITNKIKEKLVGGTLLFSIEDSKSEYDSYKEALDNSKDNYLNITSNGKTIAKIPTTKDQNTTEGLINTFILDGIISPEQVVYKGENYYTVPNGGSIDSTSTMEFLKGNIYGLAQNTRISIVRGNLIKIEKVENKSTKPSTEEEITSLIIDNLLRETPKPSTKKISESNLRQNLFKILNDMGISISTLKRYKKTHKLKNGKEVSVNALADITNRLVAFKGVELENGQIDRNSINLEDLTEEVMHFIVESLPQEQLEELSDFIKNSPEYAQHYKTYSEIYKGDQKLLEKEVLGKIMQNLALGKTEGYNKSFWNKLLDIIESFFDKLNIKTKQFNDLKSINKIVEEFVIQQTKTLSAEDIRNSEGLMYSLEDSTTKAVESLTGFLGSLKGQKQFTNISNDLKSLNLKDKNESDYVIVAGKLLHSVELLSDNLQSSYNYAKSIEEELDYSGSKIKSYLKEIISELSNLSTDLSTTTKNSASLISKIDEQIIKINKLISNSEKLNSKTINKYIEKKISHLNKEEQDVARKHYKDAIDGKVNDINYMFSFFGQLHHSSNSFLKLLGSKLTETERRKNELAAAISGKVTDIMQEKGFIGKDFNKIHNTDGFIVSDFDRKRFLDDQEHEELEAYNELVSTKKTKEGKVLPKIESIEDYRKAMNEDTLRVVDYSLNDRIEYENNLTKKKKALQENIMSDLYYKNQDITLGKLGNEVIYDELGISDYTIKFQSNNSSSRSSIKNGARDSEGVVVLSPKDTKDLENISRQRKAAKSIFSNETGIIRKGLVILFQEEKEAIEVRDGIFIKLDTENLTENELNSARLSYDLNKIDNYFKNNLNRKEVTHSKQSKLKALYDVIGSSLREEDKISLLSANLKVSLSQEYFDSLPDNAIFKEEFERENTKDGKLDSNVELLRQLQLKKNSLINLYRSSASPLEVLPMYQEDMEAVARLSEEIKGLQRLLVFPERPFNEGDLLEKQTNESYKKYLKKKGIIENSEEELLHLRDNVHSSLTRDVMNRIKKLFAKESQGQILNEKDSKFLNRYKKDSIEATQLYYAKQNLQPYFIRVVPSNYKTIEALKKEGQDYGQIKSTIEQMFEDKNLEVNIDSSILEDSIDVKYNTYKQITGSNISKEDFKKQDSNNTLPKMTEVKKELYKKELFKNGYMLNIDYNMKEGGVQPKKSIYRTGEATKFFGLNDKGQPTKNKDLYELREVVLDIKRKSYDNQESSYMDPYAAIQVSQTKTERASVILGTNKGFKNKTKAFWESIKGSVAYRADDLAYGEKNFKKNKILPKYYTHKLESTNEVSSDHFMALMMLVDKSSGYKAKKESLPEIEAISSQVYKNRYNNKGKELKNVIEMTESYIDSYIYGEQERWSKKITLPGSNFQVDLAKVARAFTNYLRLKNLGFKLTTAITGGTTGYIMKQVETYIVREKLNKESARLGMKDFKKIHKETSLNGITYKDFDKSEAYGFMQWIGEFDISEKARNSKFGPVAKGFGNAAMSMYSVADYPVTLPMALGMMRDHKIIDGVLYNRLRYYQKREREGINKTTYAVEWSENSNFIGDHIEFKNGSLMLKPSFYTSFFLEGKKYSELTEKEKVFAKQKAEASLDMVRDNIKSHISLIKGQIPSELRTTAQRHVAGSMMMMHKGYASILAQNFFKDKTLNYETGQYEEGKYRTLFRLLGTTIGGITNKDKKSIKDFYRKPERSDFGIGASFDLDFSEALLDYELKVRNSKRLVLEMSSFLALGLVFSAIFAGFDDDELDDVWAAQATKYILHRTLNESSTNLSFGLVSDIKDTIKSPLSIHMQGIDMLKVYKLFNGDIITSNKYKGVSERQKYLIKNTVMANAIYDLSSSKTIRQVTDTYNFYSKEGLNWTTLGLYHLLNNKEDGLFVK